MSTENLDLHALVIQDLRDGDVVLIRTAYRLTSDQAAHIRTEMQDLLGSSIRVAIIDSTTDVEVLRPDAAEGYLPILDDRRLDDELLEARRILNHWRLKFLSGNREPVRSRHVVSTDIDVRDTQAFFERWPGGNA